MAKSLSTQDMAGRDASENVRYDSNIGKTEHSTENLHFIGLNI